MTIVDLEDAKYNFDMFNKPYQLQMFPEIN